MFLRGLIAALAVFGMDQWCKYVILSFFVERKEAIELTSFFSLQLVWNPGISFGMFNSLPHTQWIFSGLALAVVAGLLVWMRRTTSPFLIYALALVVGGALGNTVDRLVYGAVVDFLDFHIGEYHWPAFNVADSAIFVGVAMLLIDGIFLGRQKQTMEKKILV